MDPRKRKLMTMDKVLHTGGDIDRLYVSRKEGGKGLDGIEDSVEASIQQYEDYTGGHGRRLIRATKNKTDVTKN